jgi:aconitate hydratase
MTSNSFDTRSELAVGDQHYEIERLDRLDVDLGTLPYALKILLENLVRNEDGSAITADDIAAFVAHDPTGGAELETLFTPARVLLQDFTGVPSIADLAAMRDAVAARGGDPAIVEPRVPSDLVIDHSIVAEIAGVPDAFQRNAQIEFERNIERYRFIRWGAAAFERLEVVPPSTGIVHQINLEYLATVVHTANGRAYPDTLVGLDSHTTMINGLGVLGWGVGGIEAEAAMLGQPISMLLPKVVGMKLSGELPEGTNATDLVLTITDLLREHGVVGKIVEFYGPGVTQVPLANRATIGNMSPEYGSTAAVFPIDQETLRYLRFTGRPEDRVALVEAYAKEQGLFHDPSAEPRYAEHLELDLSTVVPSLAGPARPHDRVPLTDAKIMFRHAVQRFIDPSVPVSKPADPAVEDSFPASDPPSTDGGRDVESGEPDTPPNGDRVRLAVPVTLEDGTSFELDHGDVVIAAITSCTNTSNPQVMLGAGLLARNAVERGLETKPWVKASLAPGSKVVIDYYEQAGLLPYLEKLRFNLVGYGCTTCIGNSGPLDPSISRTIHEADVAAVSVLSGNRNFEGRINPDVKLNYLASPPLVVAYALAGTMDIDLYHEPLGTGTDGEPVYLRDIWPSAAEIEQTIADSVRSEMFLDRYASVHTGDERWEGLEIPSADDSPWDPDSTYVRKPPFWEDMPDEPPAITDIRGARVLAKLGDSVTTDHISPAGSIAPGSPAAEYLEAHGVQPVDFNSYGARRGNHEVMMRGTFANIRLRNQLVPGVEGGYTVKLPEGEQRTIFDAATAYRADGTPLVVLGGREYGSGSSRDWAAKGPALLGVRAVIAESFERIHRSNLIGMGILPVQLADGDTFDSLGVTGRETIDIVGLEDANGIPREVTVRADDRIFTARVRIDTALEAAYYRNGGILHYVLRQMLQS